MWVTCSQCNGCPKSSGLKVIKLTLNYSFDSYFNYPFNWICETKLIWFDLIFFSNLIIRFSWNLLIPEAHLRLHWFRAQTKYVALDVNQQTQIVLVRLIIILTNAFTPSSMQMAVEPQVIMFQICCTWTQLLVIITILWIQILQPPLPSGELSLNLSNSNSMLLIW